MSPGASAATAARIAAARSPISRAPGQPSITWRPIAAAA